MHPFHHNWGSLEHARTMLEETNAFAGGEEAKLKPFVP